MPELQRLVARSAERCTILRSPVPSLLFQKDPGQGRRGKPPQSGNNRHTPQPNQQVAEEINRGSGIGCESLWVSPQSNLICPAGRMDGPELRRTLVRPARRQKPHCHGVQENTNCRVRITPRTREHKSLIVWGLGPHTSPSVTAGIRTNCKDYEPEYLQESGQRHGQYSEVGLAKFTRTPSAPPRNMGPA